MPADEPLTDDQIVDIAEAMHLKHGFQGRVGWHYYCEPLMASERMWRLMDRIVGKVPDAAFTLWTNGTLFPADCREFQRFAEIHVTDYGLPSHPARNLRAVRNSRRSTKVHRWRLDGRLNGIGDEVRYSPCHRMFTEFIVDYFGNVHVCCYDWQGRVSIGNIHKEPLDELIHRWHEVRNQISGDVMDPTSPEACLKCKMRSPGFTRFVPEIGMDAERFVRSSLCRE